MTSIPGTITEDFVTSTLRKTADIIPYVMGGLIPPVVTIVVAFVLVLIMAYLSGEINRNPNVKRIHAGETQGAEKQGIPYGTNVNMLDIEKKVNNSIFLHVFHQISTKDSAL